MVFIDYDLEMKQYERNIVKRRWVGAFLCLLPHHHMVHPTMPPRPTYLTLEPGSASAHSSSCLGVGEADQGSPRPLLVGAFPTETLIND